VGKNLKWMKGTNLFLTDSFIIKQIETEYNKHLEKVKRMKTNKKIIHLDTGMKGCAIGLLTYVGVQQGWPEEVVAGLVPVVAMALSWVSTKIGDKNTTLILKLVSDAVAKQGPLGPTGPKAKGK